MLTRRSSTLVLHSRLPPHTSSQSALLSDKLSCCKSSLSSSQQTSLSPQSHTGRPEQATRSQVSVSLAFSWSSCCSFCCTWSKDALSVTQTISVLIFVLMYVQVVSAQRAAAARGSVLSGKCDLLLHNQIQLPSFRRTVTACDAVREVSDR